MDAEAIKTLRGLLVEHLSPIDKKLDQVMACVDELSSRIQHLEGILSQTCRGSNGPPMSPEAVHTARSFLLQAITQAQAAVGRKETVSLHYNDVWIETPDLLLKTLESHSGILSREQMLQLLDITCAVSVLASGTDEDDAQHDINAPDFTSMLGLSYLEIKGVNRNSSSLHQHDYNILCQAIENVHKVSCLNQAFRLAFCFASTETKSWLVMMKRYHHETTGQLHQQLHFLAINAFDVLYLRRRITSHIRAHDGYMVFEDMYVLGDVCAELNVLMSTARVILVSASPTSRVYTICPGSASAKTIDVKDYQYAVKLHLTTFRGENELSILKLAHDRASGHIALSYVLFTTKYDGNTPTYSYFSNVPSSTALTAEASSLSQSNVFVSDQNTCDKADYTTDLHGAAIFCWWYFQKPSKLDLSRYRAIAMLPGTTIPAEEVGKACYSIARMWMAFSSTTGILHTDLRLANMLKFTVDGKVIFLPIDYDLAVASDIGEASISISLSQLSPGERTSLIYEVKNLDRNTTEDLINWTTLDEVFMVHTASSNLIRSCTAGRFVCCDGPIARICIKV